MDEIGHLPADPQFILPLIDSLDDGFMLMDASGRVQIWNEATTKTLGKGPATDVAGGDRSAYYGLHCPIEQRLLRHEELPLIQAMTRGENVEREIIVINDVVPQGRWIKVMARPLYSAAREIIGSAAILRDVTHEKTSSLSGQMMSWFFNASDDGILGVNMEGTMLLWNPGAEGLLGWSAEEIIGSPVYRLVPPDRHWEIDRLLQKAGQDKELPPLETRVLHKLGHEVEISRSITAMRDSQGRVIGGVIVARDISRLKQTEIQLEESRQQLRLLSLRQQNLLEQQLRALARELHDEFGQQLAAMKFELAWLERHVAAETPHLEERMESLNQLLDSTIGGLRRVSKQMRPPLLEELGLCHAIQELLVEISARYPLETSYECGCRALHFTAEASLVIYRIVQEALTNVVRHSGATRVVVSINLEGDTVVASVLDNGRGLPTEIKPTGVNFGILGMQERARGWSGEVQVGSDPEGGTLVRADFPCANVVLR